MKSMKKTLFMALALLSAFALFSCQKEKTPESSSSTIKFQITVADLATSTKATKTGWYTGDKVNIWLDGNFQKTPDLVMTYDGSSWVADGGLRSGCTPAASGTMKVIFESYNDFSKFVGSQSSTYTWFPFPTGTIGPRTSNVFNHRLVAYSYPDEYTYSGGTLTAHIENWKVLTDFQVVVAGLPEGSYAMTPSNPLRVPRGIQVAADRVYLAGNDASYYALGQPNEDGQAFYFTVDPSWTGEKSTLSVTLVDAKGHSFTFTKTDFFFGASGTYQAVKLAFDKFKGVNGDNLINGNEYVDMGNGHKWATMNVGAASPSASGDLFAWGETEPKSTYTWGSYKWVDIPATETEVEAHGKSYISKYTFKDRTFSLTTLPTPIPVWYDSERNFIGDGIKVLLPEDDAARANWGGTWRVPTKEDWQWLLNKDNCSWALGKKDNVDGAIVTSLINGNSIFFPLAGWQQGSAVQTGDGRYWIADLDANMSWNAWTGMIYPQSPSGNYFYTGSAYRYYGHAIRPVSD